VRDYDQRSGPPTAADADLFDLALVWHAVLFALRSPLRHPWLAISAFVAIFAASLGGLLLYPQRYEVSTTILAGSPLTGALVGDHQFERDAPTRAAREILLRRENLEALAKEVNFAERYLTQRPPAIRMVHSFFDTLNGKERDAKSVMDDLVETLEDRLWVNVNSENTVTIIFHWWDTQIAYDVVAAAAQSFLEMRHAAEIKTVAESIAILEEHRSGLEKQIEERIAAIEEREEKEGKKREVAPSPIQRVAPRADPELTRLQSMLAANRRAVADLESARQQRVQQLQADLIQQQTIYAPDHPSIAATKRMLSSLQQPSAQMVELQEGIRRLEAEILGRSGGRMSVSTAASSPRISEAASLLFEQDPRDDYERGQLRHLLSQLAEINDRIASSSLHMETAAAAFKHRYSVVTPPRIPKGPIKPYTRLFLASGFLGGIMLALLASVAADLRGGRVLEPWQLEHQLGVTVLGRLER